MDDRLYELYKEFYYHESKRTDEIIRRAGILVAILTALAGGISYLLNQLIALESSTLTTMMWVTMLGVVSSFVIAFYYTARFLVGHKYGHVASAKAIGTYLKELGTYNDTVKAALKKNVDTELTEFLCDQYQEAATHNKQVNRNRSAQGIMALYAMIISIAFMLAFSIPLVIIEHQNISEVEASESYQQEQIQNEQRSEPTSARDVSPSADTTASDTTATGRAPNSGRATDSTTTTD